MVEVEEPSYEDYYYDYDYYEPVEWEYRLKIVKQGGCWSYVGRWYLDQPISLDDGCEYGSTPLHEAMHAFGFWVIF